MKLISRHSIPTIAPRLRHTASSDAWRGGVTPARIWGTAAPGEQITLSGLPSGAVVTPSNPWTAAADGSWTIEVATLASLAPSNLTFSGAKNSVNITNVLFGHTFLCSGQSNMDMNVGCTYTVNQSNVDRLRFPEIRLMNQGATGQWVSAGGPSNQDFFDGFSATCYYTALNLKV